MNLQRAYGSGNCGNCGTGNTCSFRNSGNRSFAANTRFSSNASSDTLRGDAVRRSVIDESEKPVAAYALPEAFSLAAVYSPYQKWQTVYTEETALERGTLFMELDKPLLAVCR